MMKKTFSRRIVVILCFSILSACVFAQGLVTIDHKTQRFLDDVSTFDRTKYTHAHINFKSKANDAVFLSFKSDYNIHPNYVGGRSFWNPASKVKDGAIPGVKSKYTGVREVYPWYVAGGRQDNLFYDKDVDYAEADISQWSKDLANYVAQSLKKDWDWLVKYIEPFNEPMVHANEYYPGSNSSKTNKVITKICEYHRDLGQAIHAVPELANVKVMGYASAYPEFESGDFTLWNNRYKKFIDIAGADMDVFSLHIYDSSDGEKRRSGSNSEALLDIIEAYSYKTLGVVKPFAVTEYGRLVPNQEGWTAGSGKSNYDPVTNAQASRAQLHMVMNFMERGNLLEAAIPFNTNRRDITEQYAKSTLWTQDGDGPVERSSRKYLYEMLKDLKGERVRINSTNVNIQVQAFVSGKQLFVMVNNLEDETQMINMNLLDNSGLESVDVKNLKIYNDKLPELSQSSFNEAPSVLSLAYGETVVLTYNFNADIEFNNRIVSRKYYTNDFMKQISANGMNQFNFNDVETGNGEAVLRLGVGREHGLSLKPQVYINSTEVEIPEDIIRGYDQKPRTQFFGVLEIPVDTDLLQQGTNTVQVRFPDAGGHIASAILQVQKADNPIEYALGVNEQMEAPWLMIYPNKINVGDQVSIQSNYPDVCYKIFTTDGKQIKSGKGQIMTTQGIKPGMYLVAIEAGVNAKTTKLIIK